MTIDWKKHWKKIVGVGCILLGVLALVTPFTPGSWLIFVGLEMLGLELIYWKKIKEWWAVRKTKTEAVEVQNKESA